MSRTVARGFARSGQGNPDEARAARYILKDYVDGRLLFCHPPPSVSALDFNAAQQELAFRALEASGKKKAPVTRVGKDASTFAGVGVSTPGEGDAPAGQSSRSRALDQDFFRDGTGLASKPAVQNSSKVGTGGGGVEFSRVVAYPHQQAIGNDGRPIEGGVVMTVPVGKKKHYKGAKHVKHRSGKGYD